MATGTESDLEALQGSAPQPLLTAREDEHHSYFWGLQEDHPLRAYPAGAEWHPDLKMSVKRYYAILKKKGLPLLCFVLMVLVVVQFLVALPRVAAYFLESVSIAAIPGFIQVSEVAGQSVGYAEGCVYDPLSQTRPGGAGRDADADAVEDALASGCTGVEVGVWLRDRSLLVGSSQASLEKEHTLHTVYLQSLQDKLDVRNFASKHSTEIPGGGLDGEPPVGLFDEDSRQSLTLFLNFRTPIRMAWPLLVRQLRGLNEHGYLSYRNAEQGILRRPVTVVVSGRGRRRLSLMNDLSRIMGIF
ncbi:hypothetical protein BDV12DRAFT_166690 [Aspergillus spectabilis]